MVAQVRTAHQTAHQSVNGPPKQHVVEQHWFSGWRRTQLGQLGGLGRRHASDGTVCMHLIGLHSRQLIHATHSDAHFGIRSSPLQLEDFDPEWENREKGECERLNQASVRAVAPAACRGCGYRYGRSRGGVPSRLAMPSFARQCCVPTWHVSCVRVYCCLLLFIVCICRRRLLS